MGMIRLFDDPDVENFAHVGYCAWLACDFGRHFHGISSRVDGRRCLGTSACGVPGGDVAWKLKRALYGLKNAPKLWQQHLAATF